MCSSDLPDYNMCFLNVFSYRAKYNFTCMALDMPAVVSVCVCVSCVAASLELWQSRLSRVMYSMANCLLLMKVCVCVRSCV